MKQNNQNWKDRKPKMEFVYGKVPPQNRKAEEAIIGQLINTSGKISDVVEILPLSECFYVDVHQKIYDCVLKIHGAGSMVDLVNVMTELSIRNELELVGGPFGLTQISEKARHDFTIIDHASEVLECYKRREAIRIGSELIGMAYNREEDMLEFVHNADQELVKVISEGDVAQSVPLKDLVVDFNERLYAAKSNTKEVTGVNTGYHWLNRKTNGWQPGDLIILAARPSVGKTAFALNLAMNATFGEDGKSVGLFSLEMGKEDLMNRIVSAISFVDLEKINSGKVSDIEIAHLNVSIDRVAKMPIHIDDTFSVSISQMRARAKKMKRKHDIGILFVDYLQLMTGETKGGNREQEISKISRGLKGIAKELHIPVVALSQMSRAVETRGGDKGKEPQLSDLRESGAIEQDADIVMFIWHETDANDGKIKNKVKLAKHRRGAIGIMDECVFFSNIQKWMNPSEASAYMGNSTFKPFAGITPPIDERIESKKVIKAYHEGEDLPF